MEPGQKIHDYILETRIGAGGVGEVWLARHERLNKPIAIKFILPYLHQNQNVYKRFIQEATAMANLDHLHIVGVHDFFSNGHNTFLVMSYIEGGSLQDRLSPGRRLSLKEARCISRGILSALDFAHRQGVFHRDVKPSNILLGKNSHAYLVDFGIALVLGKTRVTKFGTNVGTPEYMSPEQIRSEELDHRTDVYSFGCVLYEMLAGHPPFGSINDKGAAEYTIMERHIKERPEPLRRLNPEVTRQTESVVMTALAKDKYDRFDGCADMAEALKVPKKAHSPKRHPVNVENPKRRYFQSTIALFLFTALCAAVYFYFEKKLAYTEAQMIGVQKIAKRNGQKLSEQLRNSAIPIEELRMQLAELKKKSASSTDTLTKDLEEANASKEAAAKRAKSLQQKLSTANAANDKAEKLVNKLKLELLTTDAAKKEAMEKADGLRTQLDEANKEISVLKAKQAAVPDAEGSKQPKDQER